MTSVTPGMNPYEELFSAHRSATVPDLWPWQREVLSSCAVSDGDLGVELPTGTGKTLIGLLVGEEFRLRTGASVAYLAGNKQLAQQVERQARSLNFPIVRFQGPKDTWEARDVRACNFAEAIGVMNYWNYFNANPGIEPAGLLTLDDVHLLEQPLRDFFTVSITAGTATYREILERVVARCSYYTLAQDLLNGITPPNPPEMLAFPDSVELAAELRDLLDARLVQWSPAWWAWQRTRQHAEACCWLLSARAITITPYIPPSQTIDHFSEPSRRLYLSATIGNTDDMRRRLGTPPLTKLTATVQPRQGERLVVLNEDTSARNVSSLVAELTPFLTAHRKALWLCARLNTADLIVESLEETTSPVTVLRLEQDNGSDEAFSAATSGHLVTAGRYDGMDFPDDACRVEVVPEVPIATSDLEEWCSAFLRDAAFAQLRFAQRIAQALGRCNRSEVDRAVYLLTDPEFLTRFSQRRIVDGLPDDVRGDILAALDRADGLVNGLGVATRFLAGEDFPTPLPPPRRSGVDIPDTGHHEVEGMLFLWREDYVRAAESFDGVAAKLGAHREHRAFWLAMRSLAFQLASRHGDRQAQQQARAALRAAASTGAASTFFTRLRLAEQRLTQEASPNLDITADALFEAWDRLVSRYGAEGPSFDRWWGTLREQLMSNTHDVVANALARCGEEVLGLPASAPQATSGEHDADWELRDPSRILAFEVKLAPTARRTVNTDIEQAEGAVRALEQTRGRPVRGLLVTPWPDADDTALARLERVRLIDRALLVGEMDLIVELVREYRRGWTEDSATRASNRASVADRVPVLDWLWRASETADAWVTAPSLAQARNNVE